MLAAAESGKIDEVRRLIAAGATIEARDLRKATSGRTPLMLAAGQGHDDVIAPLLAAGADVNATDEPSGQPSPGFTPSFNLGGLEVVEEEYRLGRTALMFAAAGGHINAIRALVSARADVNAADFASCTSLYLAARGGRAEAVSELMQSGAKINARGPKGGTACRQWVHKGVTKWACFNGC
ncbi:MAG TPA: ankyrin repeat domain-containing protein [Pirellulales bacterium]|nr:ankyrin repeat domain-containing protein [Pirellulales bacterium]